VVNPIGRQWKRLGIVLWSLACKLSFPILNWTRLSCQSFTHIVRILDVDVGVDVRGQGWESDKSITQIKYSQLSPWLLLVLCILRKEAVLFGPSWGTLHNFESLKMQTAYWPDRLDFDQSISRSPPPVLLSGRVLVHSHFLQSHRTTNGRRTQLFVCVQSLGNFAVFQKYWHAKFVQSPNKLLHQFYKTTEI